MSITIYNKLVRDEIPDIINRTGKKANVRTLSNIQFFIELKKKLQEEVNEFVESDNVEELADIMEVLEYLCLTCNSSLEQIMRIKQDKKEQRGGFSQRLFLQSVCDEGIIHENGDNKYLGIDVHLNRLTVACINEKLNVISIDDISVDELGQKIEQMTPLIIAVDAPHGLNNGLMNNEEFRNALNSKLEGHYNKKVSEYMLSIRGINPFSTPGDIAEVTGWNSWMNSGFDTYKIIEQSEYKHINEINYKSVNKGIIAMAVLLSLLDMYLKRRVRMLDLRKGYSC